MGNNTEPITSFAKPTTPITPIPTPVQPPVQFRSGPGGTTASGTQACAACKYQRRKCAPNCPLARHFPAHQQRSFLNAHKLFGVSNIVKHLRKVKPSEEEDAVKAMVFCANVRAADPVGGCLRIVEDLENQIAVHKAEMEVVLRQLAVFRAAEERGLEGRNGNFGGGVESTLGLGVTAVQDTEGVGYYGDDCYMGMGLLRENGGGVSVGVGGGGGGGCSGVVVSEGVEVKPLVQLQGITPLNSRVKVGVKKVVEMDANKEQWEQENEDVNVNGAVSSITSA